MEQRPFGDFVHCLYMGIPEEKSSLHLDAELRYQLFSYADRMQLPVLAETTIERNRRAYKRMGFEVYATVDIAGMRTFLMAKNAKVRNEGGQG
jgi:hypothetical protein